ncbi:hypothetical protein V8Z74_04250 [Comamonas sp. w2-DMI]
MKIPVREIMKADAAESNHISRSGNQPAQAAISNEKRQPEDCLCFSKR